MPSPYLHLAQQALSLANQLEQEGTHLVTTYPVMLEIGKNPLRLCERYKQETI